MKTKVQHITNLRWPLLPYHDTIAKDIRSRPTLSYHISRIFAHLQRSLVVFHHCRLVCRFVSMSLTSLSLSVPTSVIPQYGTTSLSLAPFEPALIASMTPSSTSSITSGIFITGTSIMVSVATATTASSDHGKDSNPSAENGECQLLGPFSIFIQAALGGLALLSLVFKRWRERPQRPLRIWGFDVSKQVVGSILLHLANLAMSMFSSGQLTVTLATVGDNKANPCSFYLLNLAIDVSRHVHLGKYFY